MAMAVAGVAMLVCVGLAMVMIVRLAFGFAPWRVVMPGLVEAPGAQHEVAVQRLVLPLVREAEAWLADARPEDGSPPRPGRPEARPTSARDRATDRRTC